MKIVRTATYHARAKLKHGNFSFLLPPTPLFRSSPLLLLLFLPPPPPPPPSRPSLFLSFSKLGLRKIAPEPEIDDGRAHEREIVRTFCFSLLPVSSFENFPASLFISLYIKVLIKF